MILGNFPRIVYVRLYGRSTLPGDRARMSAPISSILFFSLSLSLVLQLFPLTSTARTERLRVEWIKRGSNRAKSATCTKRKSSIVCAMKQRIVGNSLSLEFQAIECIFGLLRNKRTANVCDSELRRKFELRPFRILTLEVHVVGKYMSNETTNWVAYVIASCVYVLY